MRGDHGFSRWCRLISHNLHLRDEDALQSDVEAHPLEVGE